MDLPSEEEWSYSSLHSIDGLMSTGTSSSIYSMTGGFEPELLRQHVQLEGKCWGLWLHLPTEGSRRGAKSQQHYMFVRRWWLTSDSSLQLSVEENSQVWEWPPSGTEILVPPACVVAEGRMAEGAALTFPLPLRRDPCPCEAVDSQLSPVWPTTAAPASFPLRCCVH